jgi:hypothetical protein
MFPRSFWSFPFPALSMALAVFSWAGAIDTASAQVTYIEEDWVVEIATPDPIEQAPQIITALSSTNRLEDVHAMFEMNHSTLPDYQAGGMSLQIWSSDTNLDYMVHPKKGNLNTPDEVITYKMTMKVSDGVIRFEIKDGHSTTWGDWGIGGFHLSVSTEQTEFPNYSPDTSLANSKVGYAKHRVKKFSMKEVRYYNAAGQLLQTDTTERVVHQLAN